MQGSIILIFYKKKDTTSFTAASPVTSEKPETRKYVGVWLVGKMLPKFSPLDMKAGVGSDVTQAVRTWLTETRDGVVEVLRKCLQAEKPRDNYKEFLELCLIMLGALPATEIDFRTPGAYHYAR